MYSIHSESDTNLVVVVHIFLDDEGGAAEHRLPCNALLQTQLSCRPDHLVNEIEPFVKTRPKPPLGRQGLAGSKKRYVTDRGVQLTSFDPIGGSN